MSFPAPDSTPGPPSGQDGVAAQDAYEHRETLSWREIRRPLALTVAAVVALALAVLLGRWSATPAHPSTTSVDAGFARDMTAHHAQAVDMSLAAFPRATSADVRTLAYDIATTQENQRGQMMAWLQEWQLPLALSGGRMAWMAETGHHHSGPKPGQMLLSDGRMPGMASREQLQALRAASGKKAEVLYLQLMIVHHRAGVEMAQAAVAAAKQPQVVRLARSMVSGQSSEIQAMTAMLSARGAEPMSNAEAGQR